MQAYSPQSWSCWCVPIHAYSHFLALDELLRREVFAITWFYRISTSKIKIQRLGQLVTLDYSIYVTNVTNDTKRNSKNRIKDRGKKRARKIIKTPSINRYLNSLKLSVGKVVKLNIKRANRKECLNDPFALALKVLTRTTLFIKIIDWKKTTVSTVNPPVNPLDLYMCSGLFKINILDIVSSNLSLTGHGRIKGRNSLRTSMYRKSYSNWNFDPFTPNSARIQVRTRFGTIGVKVIV